MNKTETVLFLYLWQKFEDASLSRDVKKGQANRLILWVMFYESSESESVFHYNLLGQAF